MGPVACLTDVSAWIPAWLQECLEKVEAGDAGDRDLVCRAFNFAYQLHDGQCRASGEPYIVHPVEVATLIRSLGGSGAMIAAGFLHDVVEDTTVSCDEIEAQFGTEVRQLVEGVTKLSKFNFESKTERQAENFRRMFLAMAQDIRVIVVKLADRLHNMRTLEFLKPEKQVIISRETRDIFAPLANRLGIWQIKWELEDLSFKYLEPEQYRQMQSLVAGTRSNREAQIEQVMEDLRSRLTQAGFTLFEISGRPKHLYSIFKKMQHQQKGYDEIYDVSAVRIIVNTNEECYRVLAIAHDCFRPIPGRFKDYIGLPKPNRYQSLHTTVIDTNGQPIEVQIRTWEMHHIAEYGIAAHWKYKENNASLPANKGDDEKFTWLRQLVDWQRELKDDQEYIDSLRENLFDSEVYVFSPKGDVYCLPRNATPVDFAYRVHTEIGNHCAGAMVNNRMVPLDRQLHNGDIVMILRQNNAHPRLDWINFVATSTAKNRIRQWFKRSHRDENIARARTLMEKELGKNGLESLIKSDQMLKVAERCNYHSVDDMLSALGYGEISLNTVVNKLREHQVAGNNSSVKLPTHPAGSNSKSAILGIDGMLHHIAGCCKPLPGEPIMGVVTLGSSRGISVHRQDCSNLEAIPGDRLIPVGWNTNKEIDRPLTYPVDIQVETIDRVGVLKDILTRLSDNKVNVRQAKVETQPGKAALINLSVDVTDRNQFEKICSQITKMGDILSVRRLLHAET